MRWVPEAPRHTPRRATRKSTTQTTCKITETRAFVERCYRVSGDNGFFHASLPEAASGGSLGGSIARAHAMIPACLPSRPMMSPGQWFPSAPEPGEPIKPHGPLGGGSKSSWGPPLATSFQGLSWVSCSGSWEFHVDISGSSPQPRRCLSLNSPLVR